MPKHGKAKKGKKGKKKEEQSEEELSTLREDFLTIVVCTVIALFVTTYVVHPMSVPTPSMEPTILVGDRVLVDKFTIRNGYVPGLPLLPSYTVQRQDIIVCKAPREPEILLVKRVVGIPGDTLEIRDKTIYINGQPLDEPYKQHSDPNIYPGGNSNPIFGNMQRDNYKTITIPPDSYFVMGDNRDDSLDSRFWGFLPKNHIVGRPLIIFWSYQDPPDAHLRTSPTELIELYAQRLIFFVTRTRWSRMGRLVN
jgi:signal peptidase I